MAWSRRKGTRRKILISTQARSTLLGDAAHPMAPFKAQGANQALLDAVSLARCLGDGPGAGPGVVLFMRRSPSTGRRWRRRASAKVAASRNAARLLHSPAALVRAEGLTRAAAAAGVTGQSLHPEASEPLRRPRVLRRRRIPCPGHGASFETKMRFQPAVRSTPHPAPVWEADFSSYENVDKCARGSSRRRVDPSVLIHPPPLMRSRRPHQERSSLGLAHRDDRAQDESAASMYIV